MKVSINLDRLIEAKNLSQHELSRQTGIRQATINDMCQNKTKQVPLDNLAKICEVLDCDINDILELIKEPAE